MTKGDSEDLDTTEKPARAGFSCSDALTRPLWPAVG